LQIIKLLTFAYICFVCVGSFNFVMHCIISTIVAAFKINIYPNIYLSISVKIHENLTEYAIMNDSWDVNESRSRRVSKLFLALEN